MKKIDILEVLRCKKDWYFSPTGVFSFVDIIDGLPRDIYKYYLDFCIENYIDDIEFDYFYNLYFQYIKSHLINDNRYLNKKGFKNHLKGMGLKTYTLLDNHYDLKEYVCVDSNFNKRKDE